MIIWVGGEKFLIWIGGYLTSIVIWSNENRQELLTGLWAISDSRISNSNNHLQTSGLDRVLTENYPKISTVHAMAYASDDVPQINPMHVLSFGFAFSGSTLIGSTVKEILSNILSNLQEISYYDAPKIPFKKRIPSLKDVAELTAKIATNYVISLGIHIPNSAKIEIAVFGYCITSSMFRVFRLRNNRNTPAVVHAEELPVRAHEVFIFGNNTSVVEQAIFRKRELFKNDTLDWSRAPISALLEITQDDNFPSIGGPIQLCIAGQYGIRHIPVSKLGNLPFSFVGFDLLENNAMHIGGFSCNFSIGLTYP